MFCFNCPMNGHIGLPLFEVIKGKQLSNSLYLTWGGGLVGFFAFHQKVSNIWLSALVFLDHQIGRFTKTL